jgi:hypothetical protein
VAGCCAQALKINTEISKKLIMVNRVLRFMKGLSLCIL